MAAGGGGAAGAELAARGLLDAGAQALLSFGLAGGLDTAWRPGALIVPRAVIGLGLTMATHPGLSAALGGYTVDLLLGGDAVAVSAAEKRDLRERTGAAAIDLESGMVAHAASNAGVPFAVLRAICDPAERSLPPAALAALDASGVIGFGRVLASLAAAPRQLPALLALARDAAAARRALVRRVGDLGDRLGLLVL